MTQITLYLYPANFTIRNYLYPAIRQILLFGITSISLSGKFYYSELSVSGYPANSTIRNYLYLLSGYPANFTICASLVKTIYTYSLMPSDSKGPPFVFHGLAVFDFLLNSLSCCNSLFNHQNDLGPLEER